MTYSSQLLIDIFLKCITVRKNLLGSNLCMGVYFLQRQVVCLHLPLPNNICRPVCQCFTTVNADVVVLPELFTRILDLNFLLNQSIELDWIVFLEEMSEKCMQSYRNEFQ